MPLCRAEQIDVLLPPSSPGRRIAEDEDHRNRPYAVRYGFVRIFVLLPRARFADNYKRVYRVYRACGLNLRTKRPGATMAIHRFGRQETQAINQVWNMDFVQDALFNSERFRVLTVEDNCSKICLCLLVGNRSREQTW